MIIFITGIGTGIGKTLVSAVVTEALEADYLKPVQAGYEQGTDTQWVASHLSNSRSRIYDEIFRLRMQASPHIAAREEGMEITVDKICRAIPLNSSNLIMEGAGGLLVPLNASETVADLIKALHAKLILVSRNYLGSINHSLLTARICKQMELDVLGWIFNDQFMNYEEEIVEWSGYPRIASLPYAENPDTAFVRMHADRIRQQLVRYLC
jgi:dethiobiotin synthetase